MAKNQFLVPEARVLDPSPPFTHQLASGNSCGSTSHFPQQYDGANDTFAFRVAQTASEMVPVKFCSVCDMLQM